MGRGRLIGRRLAGGAGGSSGVVDLEAARLGLKGLTLQPELCRDEPALGSGNALYQLRYAAEPLSLTKCWVWVRGAGATSTGSNTMALYSADGVKLAETGDMTSVFTSANTFGFGTLGTQVDLDEGDGYYIGILVHFSSAPTAMGALQGGANVSVPAGGFNGRYTSIYATGQTSFPASFTPSALNRNSGGYCAGVS